MTERFQVWSDDWANGKYETELIPLENISHVPITMMIAENDEACTVEIAREHERRMSTWTKSIVIEGANHEYFGAAGDEWFMDTLINELQIDNLYTDTMGERLQKVGDAVKEVGDALENLQETVN